MAVSPRVDSGCHPNRDTRSSIEAAGFVFEAVDEFTERRIPLPIVPPQLRGTAFG